MTEKIIYYDKDLISKFEQLQKELETKDYTRVHRFLIDNFDYIFKTFQYYARNVASSDMHGFDIYDSTIQHKLMRPLSYRQYEIINRSFSIWEKETDLVVSTIWDFLHDNGQIYQKRVMSSAEVSGFALVLMNVYRALEHFKKDTPKSI